MASMVTLHKLFGLEILDPDGDEIATPSSQTDTFTLWINLVINDIVQLSDCLQSTATITGNGTIENHVIPIGDLSKLHSLADMAAGGQTITITVDGSATVRTEGGGGDNWTGNANLETQATSIAASLNAVTGITATATGVVISVEIDETKVFNSLVSNAVVASLSITNSKLWRVLSVSDKVNGRRYIPVERVDYPGYRSNIVVNGVGNMFIHNLFGVDDKRKLSILPIVDSNLVITIEYSFTSGEIGFNDTSMPGLLDDNDSVIVKGIAAEYWNAVERPGRAAQAFQEYISGVQKLRQEVGLNPDIKPEMSALHRLQKIPNASQKVERNE